MNTVNNVEQDEINHLKLELQQQRGMIWLLGEIMKVANTISSFKELMSTVSDMLMGVMGVTSCYLWIRTSDTALDDYTVFYRSNQLNNEFKEKKHSSVPISLRNLNQSLAFSKENIDNTLISGIELPSSRLAVPMFDLANNERFGILVVEHEKEQFFTSNTITFFETLSIFIGSKALDEKNFALVAEQSIKDPLTGTYNRRYLSVALDEMKKKYDKVTVAIVDTDNFKMINDELGHIEGDVVLKGIAQLALGIAQECNGEVVRYGGDEFVILVPEGKEVAIDILESFRSGVGYLKIAYNMSTNVSVTLGACSYPEMINECGEKLIKAADNALLRGKVKGKNRIVLAEVQDMA